MSGGWLDALSAFAGRHGPTVRVAVIRAEGSTPREVGAAMLVGGDAIDGSIGGGALEHAAITEARGLLLPLPLMLAHQGERVGVTGKFQTPSKRPPLTLTLSPREAARGERTRWRRIVRNYPLGPELAQCCGGYVSLLLEVFGAGECESLQRAISEQSDLSSALIVRSLETGAPPSIATSRKTAEDWPVAVLATVRAILSGTRAVEPLLIASPDATSGWFIEPAGRKRTALHLYGAGHVGRALVKALAGLPFDIVWVDTAADRFPAEVPARAAVTISNHPSAVAARAEPGAFHLVMTFSHALDFEICRTLLARNDFAHLGLIGSATKRARFRKRLAEAGIAPGALERLACPIGVPGIPGKEPAMIAVSVAAELVRIAHAHSAREQTREGAHGG